MDAEVCNGNQDPLAIHIKQECPQETEAKTTVTRFGYRQIFGTSDNSLRRHPTRLDLYERFKQKYPDLQIRQSPDSEVALKETLLFLFDLEESFLSERQKCQIDEIVNTFCKFFNDPIIIDPAVKSEVQENAPIKTELAKIAEDSVENLGISDFVKVELKEGQSSINVEVNEKCSKDFSANMDLSKAEPSTSVKKRFSCEYCEKRFSRRHDLKCHNKIHTGNAPFSCEFCKKTFARKAHLDAHMLIHTGEKPFSCEFCKKTFTTISNLNTHIKIHSAEKPFSCDFCQERFTQKATLESHIRRHTGEKPFSCIFCDKHFSTSSGKKKHERICSNKIPIKSEALS